MNNEFNNQNMNQFQNSNMNSQYSNNYNNLNNQNSNKGSNNGLIIILVLIIIALIGLCLFFALDKKDNNVDNNKDNNIQENESNNAGQEDDNNQNNEYDEQKLANDFFNSFKKKGNIKFNFVDDVGTVINDSSVINELKENVKIIETIEYNIGSNKYIYEIDNIKNISEDDKVGRIVFYYAGNNITLDMVEDAVSAEEVKQKFYELYGSNITFTNAIDETNEDLVFTGKGSNYKSASHTCSYREKTNMFVCRPTHGGVDPGRSRMLTHIYNYKKEGEYYYVYISVARWIAYYGYKLNRQVISSEVNDLKIYKDSDKDGDKDGELYNFKIDETNYNNFDKYRYTFKLNSDGETFRFVG